MKARYAHTNLVARDWRRLADFYCNVFGCRRLLPERDYSAPWIADLTGVEDATIAGVHLRLPGYDDDGPTLEIFQYSRAQAADSKAVNRPGFAHIAFSVDNVEQARREVLAAGGGQLGELVSIEVAGAGQVEIVYVTDPEGNIFELQKWT